MNSRITFIAIAAIVFLLALTGCSLFEPDKPIVIIESPPSGSQFRESEIIAVQSASSDRTAVVRVELVVDGNVVDIDPSPTAKGQPNFTLVQQWKAVQGQHTLLVRAYNSAGQMSDPVGVSVSVLPATAQSSAGQPTSAPTAPSAPSTAPTTAATSQPPPQPPAQSCTNSSAFVSETVPDGTSIPAGQAFTKKWTFSNNGTCTWGANYQFVFVSGEAMTPNTVYSVPQTPPGGSAEFSVAMTAPTTPGTHIGRWQLRYGSSLFGQLVNITIGVPAPTPPPPPPSACSGAPVISSFTADKTLIFIATTVTLSWGAVTNADSVEIDQGVGGVATPGSTSVLVSGTKTFTMTAHCGSNTVSKQVTVKYQPILITTPLVINPNFFILHVTGSNAYVDSKSLFCVSGGKQNVVFKADITVNVGGTVKYKWEYSDGASTGTQQITFANAGTQTVSVSHAFASSGWGKVNFISPDDPDSNKAGFIKNCISF